MWSKKLLVTLVIIGLFSAGSNCMQSNKKSNDDWVIEILSPEEVMLEDSRTSEKAVDNAAARVAERLRSTKVFFVKAANLILHTDLL